MKPAHSRRLTWTIVALGACGAWVSGELLRTHDDIWGLQHASSRLLAPICQAGNFLGLDCQGAARGAWTELRVPKLQRSGGLSNETIRIPVAFLGLAYFAFFALWFGYIGAPRPVSSRWHAIPLVLSVSGAGVSVLLLTAVAAKLARPCMQCFLVHGINILLIVLVWRLWTVSRRRMSEDSDAADLFPQFANLLPARQVFTVLTFWAMLVAGLWMFRADHVAMAEQWHKLLPYKQTVTALREDAPFLLQQYLSQAPQPLATVQAVDAAPELVAFVDYECPNCSCSLSTLIDNAKREFPDLKVRVRHYPLCRDCNPNVSTAFHSGACLGAYAAEAARLQGGDEAFWKMHQLLVTRSNKLDEAGIIRLARQAGLDADQLMRDAASDAVHEIVSMDVELARRSGVSGTPTVFFGTRHIDTRFEGPALWKTLATHFGTAVASRPAAREKIELSSAGEDRK